MVSTVTTYIDGTTGLPENPVTGALYYAADGCLMTYNGTDWLRITAHKLDGSLEYMVIEKPKPVYFPDELFTFTG